MEQFTEESIKRRYEFPSSIPKLKDSLQVEKYTGVDKDNKQKVVISVEYNIDDVEGTINASNVMTYMKAIELFYQQADQTTKEVTEKDKKEYMKEYQKRWREANKEKYKEYQQKYREEALSKK